MFIENCVLLKPDGSVLPVYPAEEKFSEEELVSLIGGDFYLIHTSNKEKCFIISESATDPMYNIKANYLFRRFVEDVIDLRGVVVLCDCELINESVFNKYLRPAVAKANDSEAKNTVD